MSFTLTATIVFAFLALVSDRSTFTDWAFKLGFVGLAIWGAKLYFGV